MAELTVEQLQKLRQTYVDSIVGMPVGGDATVIEWLDKQIEFATPIEVEPLEQEYSWDYEDDDYSWWGDGSW